LLTIYQRAAKDTAKSIVLWLHECDLEPPMQVRRL